MLARQAHTHARRTRHTHKHQASREGKAGGRVREADMGPDLLGPAHLSARFWRHAGAFCSPRVQTADEPTQTDMQKQACSASTSLSPVPPQTSEARNGDSCVRQHTLPFNSPRSCYGMLPFKGSEARNCAAAPVVRALSQSLCHAVKARGVEVV